MPPGLSGTTVPAARGTATSQTASTLSVHSQPSHTRWSNSWSDTSTSTASAQDSSEQMRAAPIMRPW